MINLIFLIYVVGYFISLYVMHKFKNGLDLNNYDPPHPDYYDDYDSNAEAYATISFMWPLFWAVIVISLIWKSLVWISTKLDTK